MARRSSTVDRSRASRSGSCPSSKRRTGHWEARCLRRSARALASGSIRRILAELSLQRAGDRVRNCPRIVPGLWPDSACSVNQLPSPGAGIGSNRSNLNFGCGMCQCQPPGTSGAVTSSLFGKSRRLAPSCWRVVELQGRSAVFRLAWCSKTQWVGRHRRRSRTLPILHRRRPLATTPRALAQSPRRAPVAPSHCRRE